MKRKLRKDAKKVPEARPEPLAMFPDAVPRGYVRVREHLRKLTPRKKRR